MPSTRARILIVDDEPIKRSVLEDELRAAGYAVVTAANPLEAAGALASKSFEVIVTDLRMPGQDGLSFLREIKNRRPEQAAIVMTAYGSVETAVEAMKLGAFDYIQKPFSTEELLLKIDKLLKYERLTDENAALRRQLSMPRIESHIIGQSAPIREVLGRIHAVAENDITVLIEGESGTGKELVARTIHETSHRASGPFVALSCAVLPAGLAESELFGHESGAFTGAVKRRMGRFELAHGGTLFLDDVDDIPLELQVKLVRVLQERAFERVGADRPVSVNVRLVAATKRSLATLAAAGKFREDLYYRLNVVPINLAPLRERLEDVPLLVEHFLEKHGIQANRGRLSMSKAAMEKLQRYRWPGNVRELEHVIERMIALTRGDYLDEADVPAPAPSGEPAGIVSLGLGGAERVSMACVLAEVEQKLIQWALERSQGSITLAAEMLGVPRTTLQYKVGKADRQES